ncbi:hypothetical protein [Mariprofundus erugo]|uniref:hypothetical protein n=1 Tax=Mariprofundus erugo TaxID=2528639 RepID=UPI001386F62D|nr:hypothetical protein [Mariprofundus erugo]
MAQSICPSLCKEAYAKQFHADLEPMKQLEGIEVVFLAENAICAPQEKGHAQ